MNLFMKITQVLVFSLILLVSITNASAAGPACGNAGHGWLPWAWSEYAGRSFTQRNHCGATRAMVGSKNHPYWRDYAYKPSASSVCKNTFFGQTLHGPGGYKHTRPNWGTSLGTNWAPAQNSMCVGQSFTQTSSCNVTRTKTGTKPAGDYTPATSSVACGESFTQTRVCGSSRTAIGTADSSDWSPAIDTVCSGESFTQTRSCGTSRAAVGTKTDGACYVCTDSDWAPMENEVCEGMSYDKVSNCGTVVSAVGNKTDGICFVDENDLDGDGILNGEDSYPLQNATQCMP